MSKTDTSTVNEPVPSHVREKILKRDEHQCQLCYARGPAAGGFATLEVHHKQPDLEGDRHEENNLITLCRDCHRWHHIRPTPDGIPVALTEDDRELLRPHDYEILQVLAENGPMTTGEVAEAITPELTTMAIRERLWRLMGLDDRVPSRQKQLIDQDAQTGEWGLADDIDDSERGTIPLAFESLLQRVEDEQVRQAVDRGVDREQIAEVFGIGYRTTFHKEERARAYQFPLDALRSNGGRPARSRTGGRFVLDEQQSQLTEVSEAESTDREEPNADDEKRHGEDDESAGEA